MLLQIVLSLGTLVTIYLLSKGKVYSGNIAGMVVTVFWVTFDLTFGLYTMLFMLHLPILGVHGLALTKLYREN